MYFTIFNKRSFLDFLSGSLIPLAQLNLPKYPPGNDEFYAMWEDKPANQFSLPSAIVVNDEALRDFMAWVSTFIGTIKPFTAFVRVIPFSIFSDFSKEMKPSFAGYESACAALIIAEALSNAPEKVHQSSLTPLLCGSTYSYALARAFACELPFDAFLRITNKVSLVRKLSGQPNRKIPPTSILAVWYILYAIRCDSKNVLISKRNLDSLLGLFPDLDHKRSNETRYYLQYISDACYQFKEYGEIDYNILRKFSGSTSLENYTVWDKSKESNVIAFKNLMNTLLAERDTPAIAIGFLCGYLACKVAPGSFSHVDLVWPYLDKYPTALLWYALFAGLSKKSDILSSSDCLPLRVIRDLLTPFGLLNIPTGDISVDELEVLFTDSSKDFSFKHGYAGHLQIEVAPNIITKLKWFEAPKPQVPQASPARPSYPDEVLNDLASVMRRIEGIYNTLSGESKPNRYSVTKTSQGKKKTESKQGKLIE